MTRWEWLVKADGVLEDLEELVAKQPPGVGSKSIALGLKTCGALLADVREKVKVQKARA